MVNDKKRIATKSDKSIKYIVSRKNIFIAFAYISQYQKGKFMPSIWLPDYIADSTNDKPVWSNIFDSTLSHEEMLKKLFVAAHAKLNDLNFKKVD